MSQIAVERIQSSMVPAILYVLLAAPDSEESTRRFLLDLVTPRVASLSLASQGNQAQVLRLATSLRFWTDMLPAFRAAAGVRVRFERVAVDAEASTSWTVSPLLAIVLTPVRAFDPATRVEPYAGVEAAFWADLENPAPRPKTTAVVGARVFLGDGPFNIGAQLHVGWSLSSDREIVLNWEAELVLVSVVL
ncbi:MAG: hypothetical protein HYV07_33890 [Deltaproteobacteria bacterium]|nr:hypothetical protein [Deltaproteobacteria bacterium]